MAKFRTVANWHIKRLVKLFVVVKSGAYIYNCIRILQNLYGASFIIFRRLDCLSNAVN